jgi:hypothetical protein
MIRIIKGVISNIIPLAVFLWKLGKNGSVIISCIPFRANPTVIENNKI